MKTIPVYCDPGHAQKYGGFMKDLRLQTLKKRLAEISSDLDLLSEAINKQKHSCQLSSGEYLSGYAKVQREKTLLEEYLKLEEEIYSII